MRPLPKDAIVELIWPMSTPVPVVAPPPKAERTSVEAPELAVLRSALNAIPNDTDPLDYDTWRNVLFAIHHATEGSDEGLALVHEFSARSGKYDAEFIDNRFWPYAGATSGEVITERTLFALAAQHGWQDPTVADDFEVVADEPPATDPRRFEFIQAAQFSAGAPPGWLVRDVLPAAELGVLYGESGSGKTFYALDLLCSIARGEDWRGHRTTKGLRCAYIAAEGAHGFRSRLNAYAEHFKIDLAALPLYVVAGAPNFLEAKDIIDLGNAMRRCGKLDVLVVDTLAQVTAGANENSGEDMGRVIAHCKTLHQVTGAMILLIHHSGKDASKGARGWSGIKGALDVEIEVTRFDQDRTATITKMKDGPGEGASYPFRLLDVALGMDDEGEVYGSCVVEPLDRKVAKGGKRKASPAGKVEVAIHQLAQNMADLGGGATVDEIVQAFIDRTPYTETLDGRDTRGQRARRALRSLVDKGCLLLDGGVVALPAGENKEEAEDA